MIGGVLLNPSRLPPSKHNNEDHQNIDATRATIYDSNFGLAQELWFTPICLQVYLVNTFFVNSESCKTLNMI